MKQKTTISLIAAVARNFAIGKNNALLCHIPGDLKRFKELTVGHTVIMGRRTLESLPNGALPNRKNIILTTMPETIVCGCVPAESIDEAFQLAGSDGEVFVIGGGAVYRQTIALADRLYLTWIDADLDGDTFFPEINFADWQETFREDHPASERCPYPFSFVNYERKKI